MKICRLIIYGYFLIICCFLIHNIEAQNKKYRKFNDVENSNEEKYPKHKQEKKYKGYKNKNDNYNEDYKIGGYGEKQKCRGKACNKSKFNENDGDFEVTREEKYSKYMKKSNKYIDNNDQNPVYKKNKKPFEFKKGTRLGEANERMKKNTNRGDEENNDENFDEIFVSKTKTQRSNIPKENNENIRLKKKPVKIPRSGVDDRKRNTKVYKKTIDEESDEDNIEIPKTNFKKNVNKGVKKPAREESEENSNETDKISTRKKKIGKKLNPIEDRSYEESEENDETDETEEEFHKTCKQKLKGKKCDEENCDICEYDNDSDERNTINKKKVKYSIKFAHEKQKSSPSEDDNIMKKIHKVEKKQYRYEDEEIEDDSSDENNHPKRVQFEQDEEE